MQAWQAAAGPGVEITPLQCSQIISASGAIHCIVKQVPRYTGTAPAVNIISPAGGDFLTPSVPFKLEWSAIDTNNADPAAIDIYVSYNSRTYQHVATTSDTGSYLWTPGGSVIRAASARFKMVATSSNGNTTEVVSRAFVISPSSLTTYDFTSVAGINKFAYGFQTASWSNVNGNPFPVSAQLTATNYARLGIVPKQVPHLKQSRSFV